MKQITQTLLSLALLSGCVTTQGEPPVNRGLAYFEITFAATAELGTETQPLPFQAGYTFVVDVTAHDYDKNLLGDYLGDVELRMQAATLTSVARAHLIGGRADGVTVTFRYGAERETISAHEVERWTSPEGYDGWRDTGKLGVSAPIYLPNATIAMIQSNHDGNDRKGFVTRYNNRNLNLAGEDLIITAVIGGGTFLTDLSVQEYGSIYLYTYSTPFVDDDGIYHALEVGTLIDEVNGSVFEFFGFTEMSFPSFEPRRIDTGRIVVDASRIPVARDITALLDATALPDAGQDEEEELEKYESSLVTVTDIIVDNFDENDFSYLEYFQFPLKRESSGAYIMAVTMSTAPTFVPTDYKDCTLTSISGLLGQHRAARPSTWILVPRSIDDIVFLATSGRCAP